MAKSSKSANEIEERVTRIERELKKMKASLSKQSGEPWYEQIVGDFKDDEEHREIVRLGNLIRKGKLKLVTVPRKSKARSARGD